MKAHLLSTDPRNWEGFNSESRYKLESVEVLPTLPPPPIHDLNINSDTQPILQIQKSTPKTRRKIWN